MNRYSPDRLAELSRFLKLNLGKENELQEIVELAADVCCSPIAMISLLNGDAPSIRFIVGADLDTLEEYGSFCQYVLQEDKLILINHQTGNKELSFHPFIKGAPLLCSFAGLPIRSENGEVMGIICIFDYLCKELTDLQQEMLHSLAAQVTRLLEFDMAQQMLKQQYEESIASTNILLTYFQSSSSCHLLMDRNMKAIAINQTLEDLIFTRHKALFNESMDVADFIHPLFLADFVSYFNRALGGEIINTQRNLGFKQNKFSWYITFEPAFDTAGKIIGVSLNATDITDNVKNKEQLSAQVDIFRRINVIQASAVSETVDHISQLSKKIAVLRQAFLPGEFTLIQHEISQLIREKEKLIDLKSIPRDLNK